MSKKIQLKGHKGSVYTKVTEFMRKKQVYTKTDIVNFLKEQGKSESAAQATAVVMLSPRLESTRGDCRGNLSNPWGHKAYNEKFKKVAGEEQKYRFRFRKEELEQHIRGIKVSDAVKEPEATKEVVKAEDTEKTEQTA